MRFGYRTLAIVCATLFFGLALIWLLAPAFFLSDWGVSYSTEVALIGRRAAALYAGFASIFMFSRNAAPSSARTALLNGTAVGSLLLAIMGLYELQSGNVAPRILAAVLVEVGLTLVLIYAARKGY